jgi:hypothetical protein
VEHNITLAEMEVFFKAEESFFAQQDKQEISQTLARQAEQVRRLKTIQDSHAKDRTERKHAKNFQRNLFRERKEKDVKIHAQELAHKVAAENKQMLKEQHDRVQQLVEYTSEKHQKERKQLYESQDRKINDQKRLLDIQTDKMGEDEKNEVVKEFQLDISHQKTLNKKLADQLRERQVIEMRQLKERANLDTQIKITVATLKAQHTQHIQRQELIATNNISRLKNTMTDVRESIKMNQLKLQHLIEVDKLASLHKQQYQHVLQSLKARSAKRRQKWSKILCREVPALNEMFAALEQNEAGEAGDHDDDDTKSIVSSDSSSHSSSSTTKGATSKSALAASLNEAIARAKQELILLDASLSQEAATRIQTLANLRLTQQQELSEKESDFQLQISEMEQEHEKEMNELTAAFDEDISEFGLVQEREREMETTIRNTETKALQERKVLTAILNTTVDGVISIDPTGFIKRFK